MGVASNPQADGMSASVVTTVVTSFVAPNSEGDKKQEVCSSRWCRKVSSEGLLLLPWFILLLRHAHEV